MKIDKGYCIEIEKPHKSSFVYAITDNQATAQHLVNLLQDCYTTEMQQHKELTAKGVKISTRFFTGESSDLIWLKGESPFGN